MINTIYKNKQIMLVNIWAIQAVILIVSITSLYPDSKITKALRGKFNNYESMLHNIMFPQIGLFFITFLTLLFTA